MFLFELLLRCEVEEKNWRKRRTKRKTKVALNLFGPAELPHHQSSAQQEHELFLLSIEATNSKMDIIWIVILLFVLPLVAMLG